MKIVSIVLLVIQALSANACCTEGSTIIHIRNYEGPIYLNGPQSPCEDKLHLTPKVGCDFDCNCASKPVSPCVPINTASQCPTLYNVPYPSLYQDNVNKQYTPGLYYNVPNYPLYQDSCYPVIQITTTSQDDGSCVCGKCGKTCSY